MTDHSAAPDPPHRRIEDAPPGAAARRRTDASTTGDQPPRRADGAPPRGVLSTWWRRLDPVDRAIASFMERVGIRLLRYSLAVVFIWFGGLKLVGMSPAEDLVRATVYWLSGDVFLPILGVWEVLIGIFLLYRPTIRAALALLFLQMPGTVLPLFLLPDVTFTSIPFGLTLEGQYIIKNLALVSAALVVGGTARRDETEADRLL